MLCPAHLPLLYRPNTINSGPHITKLVRMQFYQFPGTSPTANSRALRHSSLHTTDQVSHPHKATSKVLVLHVSIFTSLDIKRHV